MKNLIITLSLLLLFIGTSISQIVDIIPSGSTWSYYDAGNKPFGAWTLITYNDSAWPAGNAELGYGDGDEATTTRREINDLNIITNYFRKDFTISDPNAFTSFTLNMHYDDGAVVYLNGLEITRVDMPLGTPNYNTYANGNSDDDKIHTSSVPQTLLFSGNNTLSVEVHQRNYESSDLSFDLNIQGTLDPNIIGYNEDWKYSDEGFEPNTQNSLQWTDLDYVDTIFKTGAAQFGFLDGDEATVLSPVNTAYFRKEIVLADPSAFDEYEFSLLHDDGAVVYINGSEVHKENIGNGNVNYNSTAQSDVGDNAVSTFTIQSNQFVSGTNIIAVEVHEGPAITDISFDLSVRGIIPVVIKRGPYLQKGSPTSVVVKWRTDIPTESYVEYGTDINNLTSIESDNIVVTDHEIEITGLLSNTRYYYRIANAAGVILNEDPEMYFQTAPITGTDQLVRAWILGDAGTANNDARDVRDQYYNYVGTDHTDMILFLGDNAYNSGTDTQYQNAVFENMYEDKLKNTVAWSCLGNHDGYTADSPSQSGPYYDIFTFPTAGESGGMASGTEAYYSFDYANIHFIVLDAYDTDRRVGFPMYNWAQSDIQNTTQEWIVAFWHHPPYTKGSHNSDTESQLIDMRQNFLPMLEANGADLILSGHSHSYERSYLINGHYGSSNTFDQSQHAWIPTASGDGRIDGQGVYHKDLCTDIGTTYITTGSAGKITGNGPLNHPAMYYSAKSLGSAVLEVQGDTMNVKFIRENGNIDDYYTIVKGNFDTDGDGVVDCNDDCPFDPLKLSPGICGCNVSDVDTDFDGTPDCNDLCPLDGDKLSPGICGCGISDTVDTDLDGTVDCIDGCPNDSAKITPGICGCGVSEVDSDSDNTPDCVDNCPSDPNKINPGTCGCGIAESDIDGDNVPDCIDGCPVDPSKTAPGICGCGIIDYDLDGDGTYDCQDGCVTDPNKSEPGVCGCGVADIDSDNDSIFDCQDSCPNDPLKTLPGLCGCGNVDIDANNDGICDPPICEPTLHFTSFPVPDTIYETSILITSDGQVAPAQDISFSAGSEIVLEPSFEVNLGGVFHAYIEGCSN